MNKYPTFSRQLVVGATAVLTLSLAPFAQAEEAYEMPSLERPTQTQFECRTTDTISFKSVINVAAERYRAMLPVGARAAFENGLAQLNQQLDATKVSYVDVARPATAINAEAVSAEDPISNKIVSTLDKIQKGEADAAVSLGNLSYGEVLETAVLAVYVAAIPDEIAADVIEAVVSETESFPLNVAVKLSGAETPLKVVNVLAKVNYYGAKAATKAATKIQEDLQKECFSGDATPENRLIHGAARPNAANTPEARQAAQPYVVRNDGKCVEYSEVTMGDLIENSIETASTQIPAQGQADFKARSEQLRKAAAQTYVNKAFVPGEPEGYGQILGLLDKAWIDYTVHTIQGIQKGDAEEGVAIKDLTVDNNFDYGMLARDLVFMILEETSAVPAAMLDKTTSLAIETSQNTARSVCVSGTQSNQADTIPVNR